MFINNWNSKSGVFWYIFFSLSSLNGSTEIHKHDHTHIISHDLHDELYQLQAPEADYPSAGDRALNPWLYKFPPWFEPHNPPPPSLKLTIGDAAKSHSTLDVSTDFRTLHGQNDLYYEDLFVVDSHPFSDEVAKTVANYKPPNGNTRINFPVAEELFRPITESGFIPSQHNFRIPKGLPSSFQEAEDYPDNGLVIFVEEDYEHTPKQDYIDVHLDSQVVVQPEFYTGLSTPDLVFPWEHAGALTQNIVPVPNFSLLPLEEQSPITFDHHNKLIPDQQLDFSLGTQRTSEPKLLSGFYPSKKPLDFSNFKPSPLANKTVKGKLLSPLQPEGRNLEHPRSIQDIIRNQKKSRKAEKVAKLEEKANEKWIWPS